MNNQTRILADALAEIRGLRDRLAAAEADRETYRRAWNRSDEMRDTIVREIATSLWRERLDIAARHVEHHFGLRAGGSMPEDSPKQGG